MQRAGNRLTGRLVVAAFIAAMFTSAAPAQKAGEFPDDWYFYKSKRPDQYRTLEGRPARPLKLTGWIGEEQDLKKLKGKVVVVDFWATWCKPCVAAIPKNVKLQEQYREKGLVIIGVHDSKRGTERMARMAKDLGINYPLAIDRERASERAWRIRFWPSYFVIDREGIVRAAGLSPDRVDDVVEVLLNEPAPKPATAGQSVSYNVQTTGGAGTPDVPPAAESPSGIPAAWLEGTPQARRRLANLLAADAPPPIVSREWINTEPLDLESLRGKVVMVDFWGTWCGPCIRSIPKINSLHRKYKDDGLVVIGVCDHKKVEQMASVVETRGIEYPVCGDHGADMKRAYSVTGFPDYYFIDRAGKLRAADVQNARIEDVIKVLLAEPDPTATAGR
ncbi:MAG: redoxin domain-containing protein [Planctomycetota bacterium]|jgi:thiol-disulfide isomerase/thioredoxin